uniref:NADH dehydrogenase subunit 4L n=1 Tax=Megalophaedusa subulina TaxID=1885774 RepID=A0A224A1S7_9EUPU|nr:NADH dehydrogenase subunit 4L [Megalophaedusa subulina]
MFIWSVLMLTLLLLVILLFSVQHHFLLCLLTLESMVLVSLVLTIFILNNTAGSLSLFILFLTLSVCEASLGLSLLMSYIKMIGSDKIKVY